MSRDCSDATIASSRSRFTAILMTEAVRTIEQSGPLEDDAALRQASRSATGPEARLLARGRLLADRLGLDRELARWRHAALPVLLALALFAFVAAYGAAVSVVGSGRTVNAVTAFFALLAMPTVTLLVWVATVIFSGTTGMTSLFGHLSFGNLFLRLLAHLPGERIPNALAMTRSAQALLQRSRLRPWAFGFVSHMVWAVAFVLILGALWFAFSFQQYRLTWETTILDAQFFVRFVTLTGALPHWLGFPLPEAATLQNPAAAGSDHRAWAWWLIACAFVYGFLPRVLLALLSWAMWQRGVRRLHLDTAEPYYRKLLARFSELEQSQVIDVERRAPVERDAVGLAPGEAGTAHAVIGFELPPEVQWPVPGLEEAELLQRIAGTGQERRALLDALARRRPRALLVVCHAQSSPDRGTERFLREAAQQAERTALLPLAASGTDDASVRRWQDWLAHSDLAHVACLVDAARAAAWMEHAHG